MLSGHRLDGPGQVVLGSATLAQLHKRVGDTVVVQGDGIPAVRLRIVGTATLPTIGEVLSVHPTMSTGALIPTSAVPAALLDQFGPESGPNALFIRLRPGSDPAAAQRSLEKIAHTALQLFRSPQAVAQGGPDAYGVTIQLLGPQRPAEIVNYRTMGTTPGFLAGGLAVGAVAALGLTLVASVRRRRRELALLKTFGFTQRQLAAAVAWQSTMVAVVGLVVGIPLGIALGRFLWDAFRAPTLRRRRSDGCRRPARPRRLGCDRVGQPGGRVSRPHRRPDPDGARPAGRVKPGAIRPLHPERADQVTLDEGRLTRSGHRVQRHRPPCRRSSS